MMVSSFAHHYTTLAHFKDNPIAGARQGDSPLFRRTTFFLIFTTGKKHENTQQAAKITTCSVRN
jgi:hypothetical protein